jgi:DNA-binding transcriptional ArsR family regulator
MGEEKEAIKGEKECREAAERLHHLSMRYVGAFLELARGEEVALIPQGFPGVKEMRDLIDLILLTRAEINAHTALLLEAGVVTQEQVLREIREQYDWLTKEKEKFLGCEATAEGLKFTRKG